MKPLVLYLHGKGGNAEEAEHYKSLFPQCDVIGLDYKSETPRDAAEELPRLFDAAAEGYGSVILIANSIGAYFALCSLGEKKIGKAFFVSPIVNMEVLICDMMQWAGVTEDDLRARKEIPTAFGETLSWDYLRWVRAHPIAWHIPTEILYGGKDNLQSPAAIRAFAEQFGTGVTVMENGEHWFHTAEQMRFLDAWIEGKR